jgi:hypothetical protein
MCAVQLLALIKARVTIFKRFQTNHKSETRRNWHQAFALNGFGTATFQTMSAIFTS